MSEVSWCREVGVVGHVVLVTGSTSVVISTRTHSVGC